MTTEYRYYWEDRPGTTTDWGQPDRAQAWSKQQGHPYQRPLYIDPSLPMVHGTPVVDTREWHSNGWLVDRVFVVRMEE